MTFSDALRELKAGKRVFRTWWHTRWSGEGYKGQFVFLEKAKGEHREYLALKTPHREISPWVPCQSDLFAEDWETVDATK